MEVVYGLSFVEGDYEDYEIQSEEVEVNTSSIKDSSSIKICISIQFNNYVIQLSCYVLKAWVGA